jgi:pantothenate kinase
MDLDTSQEGLPARKGANTASIQFIYPFCRNELDWMAGVKMAVHKMRERKQAFFSSHWTYGTDMLGTYIERGL